MVEIKKNLVSSSKYNVKCPYAMTPLYITIHNTANDASAANEISYMIGNSEQVSYYYAVDDKEIVQGVLESRNAWHAGDGGGDGNRKSIGIEICYSKSGGDRFVAAEKNAAEFTAYLLKQRGWGIERVKKHQDWSGKYCPHRTLDMGWQRFLNMVTTYLNNSTSNNGGSNNTGSGSTLYRVQTGAFAKQANAEALASELKKKGYDTYIVKADNLFKVQVGAYSNKANADAMVSKVKAAGYDAFVTTQAGTAVSSGSGTTAATIKVGSKVKVKSGAKDYKGNSLASFVYSTVYTVMELSKDRAVIGNGSAVTAAVNVSNLILQ